MNKKIITSNNKSIKDFKFKKPSKRINKDINLHIVSNIKNHLGINTLKEVHISNILNLKVKDVEDIELGTRELSLKDISIICNCFKINPDSFFIDILKK